MCVVVCRWNILLIKGRGRTDGWMDGIEMKCDYSQTHKVGQYRRIPSLRVASSAACPPG
jgi:hypothetical protein